MCHMPAPIGGVNVGIAIRAEHILIIRMFSLLREFFRIRFSGPLSFPECIEFRRHLISFPAFAAHF